MDRPLEGPLPPRRNLSIWPSTRMPAPVRRAAPFCGDKGCIPPRSLQWRKLRDAGVLEGRKAGQTIGKLSPEQAEIARLRRQLGVSESRLEQTEAALEVMGKLSAFFENAIESSSDVPTPRKK